MTSDPRIDIAALDNRLRELGLKRWWVAEQIGVDRKTVGRWLSGRVKRIQRDNLERLAALLECPPEALVHEESAVVSATAEDQGIAARLIAQENLLEILTPTGKWPLLEEIVKAAIEPDLPLPLLGQLYNYLAIAAWRQSHLTRAEDYTAKALEIGQKTGHRAVIARARLNDATLKSFRGKVREALSGYLYCVEAHPYLEDDMVRASALSNLGMVYWEYGDFDQSLAYQAKAVAAFEALKKDTNLCIAHIGAAATLIDLGRLEEAREAVAKAKGYAERGQYRRGVGDAHLYEALIHVRRGRPEPAEKAHALCRERFSELSIAEGRTNMVEAAIRAAEGRIDESKRLLERACEVSRDYPVYLTEILREALRLARHWGDAKEAAALRDRLVELYKSCGCDAWLKRNV